MDDSALQERIELHREHVGETIEALVYKTDVVARGSEALAEGIEAVKEVAVHVTEEAAVHTVDVTVRAADALAEVLDTAEATAADAIEFAAATVESVEPRTRRRAGLYLGLAAIVTILALVWRGASQREE